MQVARPLPALRSATLSHALRASSSRTPIRSSHIDRYLVVHSFFQRQGSQLTRPPPSPAVHRRLAPLRFNSSSSSSESCPTCNVSRPIPPKVSTLPGHAQEYVPFIQRLLSRSRSHAPHSTHRPTKDELLAAASGWWEKLRIRMKWFTIRGWRRFNADDLSAFASWFVVGNTLWILIGTTTFVSAVFATLNSLSLQEYVARWISDYLTSNTGVTVIFESAIVPKWGASTITFRNVYVARRTLGHDESHDSKSKKNRIKSATGTPPAPTPFRSSSLAPSAYTIGPPSAEGENYTMFDLNLDEVEVTLSFVHWLDGKGLVKHAKVKGVRGVVDRRSVAWDTSKPRIPANFRHSARPGDFEIDTFHVEDALITVYQPGGQRPYNVSIFNAAIGPLRKRWLFYDMMSAEAITGQFDNCLFSLHMPQKIGKSQAGDAPIKRLARFRIDGLPIEHAQYATGHAGPMSWITSGKLDAVLDIKFPQRPDDEVNIKAIFEEIGRNVATIAQEGTHPDTVSARNESAAQAAQAAQAAEAAAAAELRRPRGVVPGHNRLARPPLRAPSIQTANGPDDEEAERRRMTVDIDLRFRDLKAAVPVFTSDLSVTNNAIIRPVVAFINANRTLLPIHCQVAADLSDFDGSWTLFETGLMAAIADQMHEALIHHVSSEAANSKRIRQVSVWGIQRGAEALLDTLRNVVDPVHAQLSPN